MGGELRMKASEYAKALEKTIRAKCADCCGRSKALVKRCDMEYCPLWPYRNNGSGSMAEKEKAAGERGLEGQINLFEEVRA